ncbi:nuclear transport factor 2 family protein [Sphingomonas sediminicola]|uniref:Nuclear transport factor 2 family protein n=1 Tax=Sphingomonas sediminicola TaxID=386874 RepID=A0ABX6T5V0_9SPHN|nr:nuclear transport factor 2 family protein [Sphingomonas sediminicola]QNP45160.1 nuclear transport factor 2 family protein [Sphingomonas sediminicola]
MTEETMLFKVIMHSGRDAMTIRLMLLTATALLISSCDTGKENANGNSSEAAVSVSSTADEEAIRGQVARWLELVKAKDAAAIAQLYTEDGAVMPPNTAIGKGRVAIQQTWASMMNTPGFELTFAPEQIVVSNSGTWRWIVEPTGWRLRHRVRLRATQGNMLWSGARSAANGKQLPISSTVTCRRGRLTDVTLTGR